MKDVVKANECMLCKSPLPHRRCMGLIFDRDITPAANIAGGIVILPSGEEQRKLSVHEGEEI